jgi:hypothetical protein
MPVIKNKKFWEELIAFFSIHYVLSIWYNTASKSCVVACVLIAMRTCLLTPCMITVRGDTQTYREQDDFINLLLFFSKEGK